PEGWRATLLTSVASARPEGVQWLPGPTFAPLRLAGALLLLALGTLAKLYLVAAFGAVLAGFVLWHWLRPRPVEAHAPSAGEMERRSGLPVFAAGTRSVGWWGAVCLVAILSMALAALVFSYFYIRLFAPAWPLDGLPMPALLLPLLAAGLLAASGVLVFRAARKVAGDPKADVRL